MLLEKVDKYIVKAYSMSPKKSLSEVLELLYYEEDRELFKKLYVDYYYE